MEKKKEKTVKKAKQLNPLETLNAFINEVKESKEIEGKETDYSKVFKFCQITWVQCTKMQNVPLDILKPQLIGNIQIKVKKKISDNCIMFSIITARGQFSCKVICETAPYKPSEKGIWGVNPIWHKF